MREIVGHKRQKKILNLMIKNEAIPHALLFEGGSKLGKKSLALKFAQELLGEENHPDLKIVSDPKEIQIDQIRDLINHFSLKPYSAQIKVAIIDDAHLMNISAQNSILKLLEEPKGDSLITLITEYPDMLLETIRSRTERIVFSLVEDREIEAFLEKNSCQDIEKIVSFSFGKPGVAIDFMNNPSIIEERSKSVQELLKVTSSKALFRDKFNYAKELSEDLAEEKLRVWLDYFRAIMINKAKKKVDTKLSFGQIKKSLELIEESIYLISRTNTNNRIVLERLMLEL